LGRVSAFVLPVIVGVGLYFLLIATVPGIGQFTALAIGIIIAWAVRFLLKRVQLRPT
jgi:putative flippase GtrA